MFHNCVLMRIVLTCLMLNILTNIAIYNWHTSSQTTNTYTNTHAHTHTHTHSFSFHIAYDDFYCPSIVHTSSGCWWNKAQSHCFRTEDPSFLFTGIRGPIVPIVFCAKMSSESRQYQHTHTHTHIHTQLIINRHRVHTNTNKGTLII